MSGAKRIRWFVRGVEHGWVVALAALAMYWTVAPHHVIDPDNAEFATLSVTGGAAHPSGYPAYVLWLRLWSWLPAGSPAHIAALSTSLLGSASVLVLHSACRAWGARSLGATLATAMFAAAPVVLRVATEAEVFAMNNLIVATVLWLSAAKGPLRSSRRAFLLGLVAGLGVANHLTCVLVMPVGLLGIVRAAHERNGIRPEYGAAVAIALAGFGVGLLPYVYLLVAPDTPMSWGQVRSVGRLIDMFLRRDYGGVTAFAVRGQDVDATENIVALLRTLCRAWLLLPAAAGLVILALRCVRSLPGGEPRAGWRALGMAWLVAGPLLAMQFNVRPTGIGLYVNQRFHLLPVLLLAIPVSTALGRFVIRREVLINAMCSVVGVVALAAASLGYLGRMHTPAVEIGIQNMLRSLPPNAVVIHGQDDIHAVAGYLQTALGVRRDITVVTWPMMAQEWYRARAAARGILAAPGAGAPRVKVVRALLRAGRPVFVDRGERQVAEAFATYPFGMLLRVVAVGEAVPTAIEVLAENESIFAKFALDYPKPGPDDEYATEIHKRYSDTWRIITNALERGGFTSQAARARRHAEKLAPRAD